MTAPIHIDAMYAGTPRPLGERKIASAIAKSALPGPWEITLVGLVGDAAGTTGDPDPLAATFAGWLDGDLTARIPGGESGVEVVERYGVILEEIADSHRGESVLVVSHGGVMCMALSTLARNLTASHSRDLPMPSCGVVALEADADGWVARSWAGRPLDPR